MSEISQANESAVAVAVETPLHYFLGQSSGTDEGGLLIREAGLRGYLNLRGDPDNQLFLKYVQEVLGVRLPIKPGTYVSNTDTSIYWLGPSEWLVLVAGGAEVKKESRLRQALRGHFSIVDVSGGLTLINLRGEGADVVLKKSSVYDFHPRHFCTGRCVQTTLAKATALVSKREDGSFDMVIRRSFADYLAKWLLDAAREFGCRIERGSV